MQSSGATTNVYHCTFDNSKYGIVQTAGTGKYSNNLITTAITESMNKSAPRFPWFISSLNVSVKNYGACSASARPRAGGYLISSIEREASNSVGCTDVIKDFLLNRKRFPRVFRSHSYFVLTLRSTTNVESGRIISTVIANEANARFTIKLVCSH